MICKWIASVTFALVFVSVWPGRSEAQVTPEVDSALRPYHSTSTKLASQVRVGTSETFKRLMELWTEGFRHHHKGVKFETETILDPEAPKAFITGVLPIMEGANLVALSYPMEKESLEAVRAQTGVEPIQVAVALDAIVLVVHHRNPLEGLTLSQVQAIFSKAPDQDQAIGQWRDVGINGKLANVDINRYGRDGTSGTFAAFKKMALHGAEQLGEVHTQPGSMSVVLEVGTDPAGIGYAATGFAKRSSKVRVVPLARKDGETFVKPVNETVLSGEYPLTRELYMYALPRPDGTIEPTAKEFMSFVLSKEGQQLVKEDGFIPLPAPVTEQALRKLNGPGESTSAAFRR